MNFNASRNVNQSGGLRKAKRVSDVAAMGAPSPTPGFSPGPAYSNAGSGFNVAGPAYSTAGPDFSSAGFNVAGPDFSPAGPPPPYQEGIHLDNNPNFNNSTGDFNYMGGFVTPSQMASPAQLGAMLQQPVVQDMALQYGGRLAQQSKEVVQREINKFVPVSSLRYYFAVDTRYVLRKILLILFPFTHQEWMVKYDQDSPVQPRYDINAPDLYIPSMGYVTYVLLTGFTLGLQHRFSPEQIGIQSSSALAYIIFEMLMYLITLYITNTSTNLKTLDLLAFSGYKYTIMITSLIGGLLLSKTGYYCALVYTSLALSYFLVKTLRVQVLSGSQKPERQSYGYPGGFGPAAGAPEPAAGGAGGTKRRLYFLLFVAVTQPLVSWWLTYHLVPAPLAAAAVAAPT